MAHTDLGDLYSSSGDLFESLRSYCRSRDYCTSVFDVVKMCLNVVRVSVDSDDFSYARQYATKAQHVLSNGMDAKT